ncbi:MAG: hypothetical protein AAFV53_09645 [Myxococcota bacterium]
MTKKIKRLLLIVALVVISGAALWQMRAHVLLIAYEQFHVQRAYRMLVNPSYQVKYILYQHIEDMGRRPVGDRRSDLVEYILRIRYQAVSDIGGPLYIKERRRYIAAPDPMMSDAILNAWRNEPDVNQKIRIRRFVSEADAHIRAAFYCAVFSDSTGEVRDYLLDDIGGEIYSFRVAPTDSISPLLQCIGPGFDVMLRESPPDEIVEEYPERFPIWQRRAVEMRREVAQILDANP